MVDPKPRSPFLPGQPTTVELQSLWGNYTYQIGVTYKDKCGNRSELVAATVTTESQKFQQVEGFCFLATAAFGAGAAAFFMVFDSIKYKTIRADAS